MRSGRRAGRLHGPAVELSRLVPPYKPIDVGGRVIQSSTIPAARGQPPPLRRDARRRGRDRGLAVLQRAARRARGWLRLGDRDNRQPPRLARQAPAEPDQPRCGPHPRRRTGRNGWPRLDPADIDAAPSTLVLLSGVVTLLAMLLLVSCTQGRWAGSRDFATPFFIRARSSARERIRKTASTFAEQLP